DAVERNRHAVARHGGTLVVAGPAPPGRRMRPIQVQNVRMSRALVLSSGGSVGIAWQSGLVVGLAEAGVALAGADAVVGTSAGSAVGAQIKLGRDLNNQIDRYRSGPAPTGASAGQSGGGAAAS